MSVTLSTSFTHALSFEIDPGSHLGGPSGIGPDFGVTIELQSAVKVSPLENNAAPLDNQASSIKPAVLSAGSTLEYAHLLQAEISKALRDVVKSVNSPLSAGDKGES